MQKCVDGMTTLKKALSVLSHLKSQEVLVTPDFLAAVSPCHQVWAMIDLDVGAVLGTGGGVVEVGALKLVLKVLGDVPVTLYPEHLDIQGATVPVGPITPEIAPPLDITTPGVRVPTEPLLTALHCVGTTANQAWQQGIILDGQNKIITATDGSTMFIVRCDKLPAGVLIIPPEAVKMFKGRTEVTVRTDRSLVSLEAEGIGVTCRTVADRAPNVLEYLPSEPPAGGFTANPHHVGRAAKALITSEVAGEVFSVVDGALRFGSMPAGRAEGASGDLSGGYQAKFIARLDKITSRKTSAVKVEMYKTLVKITSDLYTYAVAQCRTPQKYSNYKPAG